jgi:hypothetical protein
MAKMVTVFVTTYLATLLATPAALPSNERSIPHVFVAGSARVQFGREALTEFWRIQLRSVAGGRCQGQVSRFSWGKVGTN